MSGTSEDTIVLTCTNCGKKLRFKASSAGKKGRCPACGVLFRIERPAGEPAPSAVAGAGAGAAPPADSDDLLSQLAGGEPVAAAPPPLPSGTFAPPPPPSSGGAAPSAGAGTAVKAAGVALARRGGRLLLGCSLAGAVALLGAAAWVFIGVKAKLELGILAWALGAGIGAAMAFGYRQASQLAGLIAAGIAFVSIMGAKLAIFLLVIYFVITGDTQDIEMQRAYVTFRLTLQMAEEQGYSEDDPAWEQHWEELWPLAEQEVKGWDDETVRQRWAEFREEDQRLALAEQQDEPEAVTVADQPPGEAAAAAYDVGDGELADDRVAQAGPSFLALFFTSGLFGLFDLIFFGLALFSAYGAGARGWTAGEAA